MRYTNPKWLLHSASLKYSYFARLYYYSDQCKKRVAENEVPRNYSLLKLVDLQIISQNLSIEK